MALSMTDMPLDELREYRPHLPAPDGLDDFWRRTLDEARAAAGEVVITAADSPVTSVRIEDLTFPGFGGDPIRAWIIRPLDATPAPAVIEFIGYGGGRGLAGEKLSWGSAGVVHVVMDSRGQGSAWGGGGDTPDPHGAGPAVPGFMTRGILDPETYYYRRLFTDAVRLTEVVAGLPFVDASRIAVTGGSQGGALALAAGALSDRVAAVMADVPFLCDFPRAISKTPEPPFTEITRFLSIHRGDVDAVLRTLSYVDCAILARSITVPAYLSVALMDEIVLPSTVFAAYNAIPADDKTIEVYAYNGHEGGAFSHWPKQVAWLRERFSG